MKKIIAMAMCAIMALTATGCGNTAPVASKPAKTEAAETTKQAATLSLSAAEKTGSNALPEDFDYSKVNNYSEKVNDFAIKLAKKIGKDTFFASPYSVYLALLALDTGAAETAKEQLDSALIPAGCDADTLLKYTGSVIEEMENNKFYKFDTASLFAADDQYKIDPEFAKKVVQYLEGETATIDFADENAYLAINKWAEEKTNGMIKNLNKEPIPADTAMIIANSIYFLGKWSDEFDPEETKTETFHGKGGDTKVEMMSKTFAGEGIGYAKNDVYQAAVLDYKGGASMIVYLPNEGKTTADVLDKLEKTPQDLANPEQRGIGTLRLPKFETETTIDLDDAMKAMGLTEMYKSGLGGMLGMNEKDAFLSKLFQKAKIKVDEKGTEAAAVTEGQVNVTSMPAEPVQFNMTCDKPFVYSVVINGNVAFMGVNSDM